MQEQRYQQLHQVPVRFMIDGAWHEGEKVFSTMGYVIVHDRFSGLHYTLNREDVRVIDTPHMETE